MKNTNRIKLIIAITALIDIIGIGIVIPLLPFYVSKFSTSPITITWLFVVYSFCSFLSAPILGKLSDHFGRKPILMISIASTALGWILFAFGGSLWVLYLGRVIDGLAAGNITAITSSLSDISKDENDRMKNMGIIGSLFGIGFIIGPLLGGLLGIISPQFAFCFVAILAILNFASIYFFMPETNTNISKLKIDYHPLRPIADAWRDKVLRPIYFIYFLIFTSIFSKNAIFILYLSDVFKFGQTKSAFIMAGIGLTMVLNYALLMNKFWMKKFSGHSLRIWSIFILACSTILFVIGNNIILFAAIVITTLAESILRATLMGYISNMAEKNKRGETMGILTAMESLAVIAGPFIVGPLYAIHHYYAFIFASIVALAAFIIGYNKLK